MEFIHLASMTKEKLLFAKFPCINSMSVYKHSYINAHLLEVWKRDSWMSPIGIRFTIVANGQQLVSFLGKKAPWTFPR